MKPLHLFSRRLCLGALVCCSLVSVRADPLPTSMTMTVAPPVAPAFPEGPPIHPIDAPPAPVAPTFPKSLTSVVVDYGESPRGESVKLLEASVTFTVKEASFLTALDAVLASAGRSCRVECRGIKPTKITLHIDSSPAGPLLDTLARSGGARMWVFPSKLILAPEALLTADEKKSARLYGVLKSVKDLPPGSTLGKINDPRRKGSIIDGSNRIISVNFNNSSWSDSLDAVANIGNRGYDMISYPTQKAHHSTLGSSTLSASLQDVKFGEALAFIAHANGCELFLLPDAFLIWGANDPMPDLYKKAVPAFTPASTHFDFDHNPDSSAPGA